MWSEFIGSWSDEHMCCMVSTLVLSSPHTLLILSSPLSSTIMYLHSSNILKDLCINSYKLCLLKCQAIPMQLSKMAWHRRERDILCKLFPNTACMGFTSFFVFGISKEKQASTAPLWRRPCKREGSRSTFPQVELSLFANRKSLWLIKPHLIGITRLHAAQHFGVAGYAKNQTGGFSEKSALPSLSLSPHLLKSTHIYQWWWHPFLPPRPCWGKNHGQHQTQGHLQESSQLPPLHTHKNWVNS